MADDTFAGHPLSVAEIRSDRTGSASDWTPRDALIATLRRLDAGEIAPSALVIAWADLGDAAAGVPLNALYWNSTANAMWQRTTGGGSGSASITSDSGTITSDSSTITADAA